MSQALGLEKVRVLLKPNAIPTIFERPTSQKRECEFYSSRDTAAKKGELHMKSESKLGYIAVHNILLHVLIFY